MSDDIVSVLLPVAHQIGVRAFTSVQDLVYTDVRVFERRDRRTRKGIHMYFVRGLSRDYAYGVVESRFYAQTYLDPGRSNARLPPSPEFGPLCR